MEEELTETSRAWRIARICFGVLLIPLGIVGLFLPVLQGVLFLLVGLALLSSEVPFFARIRDAIRERYPRPFEEAERLGARLRAWFREKRGDRADRRNERHERE